MDYQPKNLRLWTMPDNYFGAVWPAYYSAGFGRSRDSDDLEESNFATALAALGGESETVEVVRESHWAVGWVEWIAIHQDDDKALHIADDLVERYRNYPCLNEDDWSDRECNRAQESWENSDLRERIRLCCKAGLSMFAARSDGVPQDDIGYIQEMLLGH